MIQIARIATNCTLKSRSADAREQGRGVVRILLANEEGKRKLISRVIIEIYRYQM